MKIGILFDRLVNLALVVAVVYGAIVAGQGMRNRPPLPYAKGDKAPSLPGVDYASSEKTLVLYVQSKCHFCTESMEFYASLVAARDHQRRQVRIIAVSRESKDVLDGYLAEHHLKVDQTFSVERPGWEKLGGTPTQIVIGRAGQIELVWLGKMSADAQTRMKNEFGLTDELALAH